MGTGCWHVEPHHHDAEHPVTAAAAVLAVLLAVLLICWAAIEIHGTRALDSVVALASEERLPESAHVDGRTDDERELDHAVAASRFATGLSP